MPGEGDSKILDVCMIIIGGLIFWCGVSGCCVSSVAKDTIIPGAYVLPILLVAGGIGLIILANHNLSKK